MRSFESFAIPTFGDQPIAAADVDLDGAADIVMLDLDQGVLWAHHGRHDRDFGPPKRLSTSRVTRLHRAVDFQGLGLTDLLIETPEGPAILLGSRGAAPRVLALTGIDPALTPSRWRFGDLNGDGRLDLVAPGATALETYLGDGAGGFRHAASSPSSLPPFDLVGLADVDGDGRLDAISSRAAFHGDGAGGFTLSWQAPLPVPSGLGSAQLADLDGDGRTDLFGRQFPTGVAVLINRCTNPLFARSFAVPVVLSMPGLGEARFSSEVVLTNRGPTDVTVELSYTAAFGGGDGVATLVLAAGRQRIVEDAIAELRSLNVPIPEGEGLGGSLRVRFDGAASPADVSVSARTRSPFATGEVGVGFATLLLADAFVGRSTVPLLRETGDTRTNRRSSRWAGRRTATSRCG